MEESRTFATVKRRCLREDLAVDESPINNDAQNG